MSQLVTPHPPPLSLAWPAPPQPRNARLVQALEIVEVTDREQKAAYDKALAAIDAAESNEDLEGLPVGSAPVDTIRGARAHPLVTRNRTHC
jgi:hypothetical protein